MYMLLEATQRHEGEGWKPKYDRHWALAAGVVGDQHLVAWGGGGKEKLFNPQKTHTMVN